MKKIILIIFLLVSSTFATDSTLIKELEARIKSGDKEAQLELGQMYARGKGVRFDFFTAEELIKPLAISGNAKAQYLLGSLYYPLSFDVFRLAHSRYRRTIDSIAVEYADSLGISKKPDSLYNDMLKRRKIQESASDWHLKDYSKYKVESRKVGNALTDYLPDSLVEHIRDSVFYDMDAGKWFLLAAENGLPEAQCELAWHYQQGLSISYRPTPVYKEKFYWLEQAANQDYGPAQAWLGQEYSLGFPLQGRKKFAQGYMWLSIAIEKDLEHTQYYMDELMKIISEEDLQEGQKLLDQWYAEHPK